MRLYKKTILICTGIFAVCLILSVVFKFSCLGKFELFLFLKDYMLGIACSLIVVFITTYVQFKFEQRKILNSILSNIQFFFFRYLLVVISLDPSEHTSSKLWEHYYDTMEEDIRKITNGLSDIEWFSKKKSKVITELHKCYLHLLIEMSKALDNQKEDAVKRIVGDPMLKKIKDNALLLAIDNEREGKEIVENFEKAQKYLNNLKGNEDGET